MIVSSLHIHVDEDTFLFSCSSKKQTFWFSNKLFLCVLGYSHFSVSSTDISKKTGTFSYVTSLLFSLSSSNRCFKESSDLKIELFIIFSKEVNSETKQPRVSVYNRHCPNEGHSATHRNSLPECSYMPFLSSSLSAFCSLYISPSQLIFLKATYCCFPFT